MRKVVLEEFMEIAQKVKEIISQQLDVDIDQIQETSSFIDDLGADSLAIVELVLALEENFDIDIPDEDTEKIQTVGDAVNYIRQRGAGA
jgi:acyl carrier protein